MAAEQRGAVRIRGTTWPGKLRPIYLIGAFLPDFEHGSGIDDCIDGGGVVLKRIKA